MADKQASVSLWKERNFLRLWLATVLSTLGDAMYFVLIGWFVVDVTGSELALGTTMLCASLPRLFFMLAGGVVADRINRKFIMFTSVLARAVVLGSFALYLFSEGTFSSVAGLYAIAIIFGIVDAFFWPARDSILPYIVDKERLGIANSLFQTSMQLSQVLGPLLAAGLFLLKDYAVMFLSLCIFFLLSSFFLIRLRLRQIADRTDSAVDAVNAASEQPAANEPPVKTSALRDIGDGIRYVLSIRVITLIMVIALFLNVLIMGPFNIALPLLVKQLGWTGSDFSYLQGAFGFGAIFGGLLTGLANGFRGYMRFLGLMVALSGVTFGCVSLMTHGLWMGLLFFLLTGMLLTMVNIPIFTYIQTVVESRMLGRVTSLLNIMALGLTPVSYAVCSSVMKLGVISAQSLFVIGGVGVALIGLFTFSVREFRLVENHPLWIEAGQSKAKQPHKKEAAVL